MVKRVLGIGPPPKARASRSPTLAPATSSSRPSGSIRDCAPLGFTTCCANATSKGCRPHRPPLCPTRSVPSLLRKSSSAPSCFPANRRKSTGAASASPGPRRHPHAQVFVMVLSYSRALWAELVFDLSIHSLRRSLIRAADHFGGCPRTWLFDNPKTVVLHTSRRPGSVSSAAPGAVRRAAGSASALQGPRPMAKGSCRESHALSVGPLLFPDERFLTSKGRQSAAADSSGPFLPNAVPTSRTARSPSSFPRSSHSSLVLPNPLPCIDQVQPIKADSDRLRPL